MADVFISYSRRDKDFALEIHKALEDRKREAWVDWDDIPLTSKWLEEIYSGIESADAFAFLTSPDSVASKHCRLELKHAVKNNKRLLPIMHREVDDEYVPPDLTTHQYVLFRETDDFQRSFESLMEALDLDLEWVRAHTRLLIRAKEWDREGRDASFLLRGKELEAAETLQIREAEKEPKLTSLQVEYVFASRQAAMHHQRRLLRAVAFALIVAVVLVLLALWQWREANNQKNTAVARLMLAQAESASGRGGVFPRDSVLLAAEAKRRLPSSVSVEADPVLRRGLALLPRSILSLTHESRVRGIAFSPDGKYLATAGEDSPPGCGMLPAAKKSCGTRITRVTSSSARTVNTWPQAPTKPPGYGTSPAAKKSRV